MQNSTRTCEQTGLNHFTLGHIMALRQNCMAHKIPIKTVFPAFPLCQGLSRTFRLNWVFFTFSIGGNLTFWLQICDKHIERVNELETFIFHFSFWLPFLITREDIKYEQCLDNQKWVVVISFNNLLFFYIF